MQPLIITNAKRRYAYLLILDIVLLVLSALLLAQPDVRASSSVPLGWLAAVTMGVGVPLLAWQLFDNRPYLIVDRQGVWYRAFGTSPIPWSDITGATMKWAGGYAIICLELRNPDEWLAKLPAALRTAAPANAAMGYGSFALNLSRLEASPDEVIQRILAGCARARTVNGRP